MLSILISQTDEISRVFPEVHVFPREKYQPLISGKQKQSKLSNTSLKYILKVLYIYKYNKHIVQQFILIYLSTSSLQFTQTASLFLSMYASQWAIIKASDKHEWQGYAKFEYSTSERFWRMEYPVLEIFTRDIPTRDTLLIPRWSTHWDPVEIQLILRFNWRKNLSNYTPTPLPHLSPFKGG